MNVVTNNKWIGQRTIRPDGVDKVTGPAAFAAATTMPAMISGRGQCMSRAMTAHLPGIPQTTIRPIPAEIGGGFGGKTIVYLEPLATLLAQKSGRPEKMVMTREEGMRGTGPSS